MLRLVGCVLIALAFEPFWASPAVADGVVYRIRGCGDHLFVSTQTGFSVLSGNIAGGVKERDELRGDVERVGHSRLFDRTAGTSVIAVVEEVRMDKAEADRRIAAHCQ